MIHEIAIGLLAALVANGVGQLAVLILERLYS